LEGDVVCVPKGALAVVCAGDVNVWIDPTGVDDLARGVDGLAFVSTGGFDVLPDGGILSPAMSMFALPISGV
jgi:hypothetical protein